MCYKRPGPRCSAYATKRLAAARIAFDANPTWATMQAYELAREDFYITPKGLEYLASKIDSDPLGAIQYEHYKELRRLRIAEAKHNAFKLQLQDDDEQGEHSNEEDEQIVATNNYASGGDERAVGYKKLDEESRRELDASISAISGVRAVSGNPYSNSQEFYLDGEEEISLVVDQVASFLREKKVLTTDQPAMTSEQMGRFMREDGDVIRDNGRDAEGYLANIDELVDYMYWLRDDDGTDD